jgi:hypothetical protein
MLRFQLHVCISTEQGALAFLVDCRNLGDMIMAFLTAETWIPKLLRMLLLGEQHFSVVSFYALKVVVYDPLIIYEQRVRTAMLLM